MMRLPAVLSEGFLRALSAEERKKLGRSGVMAREAQSKYAAGQERELKKDVLNELNRRGAWVFHQPMSKRTRGRLGVPDILCCYKGKFLALELKTGSEALTPGQVTEAVRLEKSGGKFVVCHSLKEVIKAVRET
jgi:Holliday junction resolvase